MFLVLPESSRKPSPNMTSRCKDFGKNLNTTFAVKVQHATTTHVCSKDEHRKHTAVYHKHSSNVGELHFSSMKNDFTLSVRLHSIPKS